MGFCVRCVLQPPEPGAELNLFGVLLVVKSVIYRALFRRFSVYIIFVYPGNLIDLKT